MSEVTNAFGEQTLGFRSPVTVLLGALASEAANPLDNEGREVLIGELEQKQQEVARAAGKLYEACRGKQDVLVPGEHADAQQSKVGPYLGASFFVGELFVRLKFVPSAKAEDELHWFSMEVLPNVENKEPIMADETNVDEHPLCGVSGTMIKDESTGEYRRMGLRAEPSISDMAPRTRQEFFDRAATALAFSTILEACENSLN